MSTNPFKFGTVVEEPFFTDREKETEEILSILGSENHLILTGPRRYGKTSLVRRACSMTGRPVIYLDLQVITGKEDFAAQLLKRVYRMHPVEKLKKYLTSFRLIPALILNPVTGEVDVRFHPEPSGFVSLEDVFDLLQKISTKKEKLVVVLDEFQEIKRIHPELDRNLRAIMQLQVNINYIFLGSRESLIREIFEKKKSPFYHFGYLMQLDKIPSEAFTGFLEQGFRKMSNQYKSISARILEQTRMHPYYTQQLAFTVWEMLARSGYSEDIVLLAGEEIIRNHDNDFERLWNTLNRTDMKILIGMADCELSPLSEEFSRRYNSGPSSTVFSSLKRLTQSGILIRSVNGYNLDDPFFKQWIMLKRAS